MAPSIQQKCTHVIFDLDGTLIDTESVLLEVTNEGLSQIGEGGYKLSEQEYACTLGLRALDACQKIVQLLQLPITAEELFQKVEPLYQSRLNEAQALPGAIRLVQHLKKTGVEMAIATSSRRATFDKKISCIQDIKDCFRVVVCGDEVEQWPDFGCEGIKVQRAHQPTSQCQGKKTGVEMAIATSSRRATFDKKIGCIQNIKDCFKVVVCGDEVEHGKPNPEVYLQAASKLGVAPNKCLVFEDAPNGIKGSCAAGMSVIAVPYLLGKDEFNEFENIEILSSLLDFHPEQYGLPEFTDYICESVPLSPVWHIKGTVVKGFGRGSQQLGIPTANLDSKALQQQLTATVTGIYYGWAWIGSFAGVYKMVMSIGWNPFYQNNEKTAEPWILHNFGREFYGDEIKLLVCGYIRPESNFDSLEALIARIHKDGDVAREALDNDDLAVFKNDPYFSI
eukprot:TRINITY_DN6132_c0_g1_i4.p1 TRINITY_DN6132_c0_g1~~TRINITY_DN6132_c0_g1_i4.p1  ORF type:complete len:450 (+),score=87.21 TRINITY_DN6132_c0_g1_i4:107-1456(+)